MRTPPLHWLIAALALVSAAASAQSVQPFLYCISPTADYSAFVAYFGYENLANEVEIPNGVSNHLVPAPIDQGTPPLFWAGYRERAFRVAFAPTVDQPRIIWNLLTQSASADWTSPLCPESVDRLFSSGFE